MQLFAGRAVLWAAQHSGIRLNTEEPPVGKVVISSLVVDATDDDMIGIARQISTIFTNSNKGGWMLIETEDAHNAVWVNPALEIRLEFDERPSLEAPPSPSCVAANDRDRAV